MGYTIEEALRIYQAFLDKLEDQEFHVMRYQNMPTSNRSIVPELEFRAEKVICRGSLSTNVEEIQFEGNDLLVYPINVSIEYFCDVGASESVHMGTLSWIEQTVYFPDGSTVAYVVRNSVVVEAIDVDVFLDVLKRWGLLDDDMGEQAA